MKDIVRCDRCKLIAKLVDTGKGRSEELTIPTGWKMVGYLHLCDKCNDAFYLFMNRPDEKTNK